MKKLKKKSYKSTENEGVGNIGPTDILITAKVIF